jgi:DNA-binding beta-propeller fold protein YncE
MMGIFKFSVGTKHSRVHRNCRKWVVFGLLFALIQASPLPLWVGAGQVYAQIDGDFDGDSDVDVSDLLHFASQWLNSPCGEPNWCEGADFNQSNRVDLLDFASLAGNWGPAQPDNFSLVSRNIYPTRMAIGQDEKIYVTDFKTNSVFVYQSNLNDPNSKDLVGELKGIDKPLGIALDNQGNIFIGSSGRKSVEVYNPQGVKTAAIGRGLIEMPNDLKFDNAGRLYVADSKSATIWVFGPNGALQRSIGKPGTGDGQFRFPAALAIAYRLDEAQEIGELYVADQESSLVQVFDLEGNFLRSFGGMVIEHGSFFSKWYEWEGYFVRVQSLAFDDSGQLHALDCYLDKVQILDPDTGAYLSSYGENGTGPGQLDLPTDMAIDNAGRTVVTDGRNQKVEIIYTASQ